MKLASDVANFSSKLTTVDLRGTVYLQAYGYFIQISTECIVELLVLIVYIYCDIRSSLAAR